MRNILLTFKTKPGTVNLARWAKAFLPTTCERHGQVPVFPNDYGKSPSKPVLAALGVVCGPKKTPVTRYGNSLSARAVMVAVKLPSSPWASRHFIMKSIRLPPPQPAQQCQ